MKSISLFNSDFLTIKTGNSALSESIERILMTSPGERVNNPAFGCKLKPSLFNFSAFLTEDIVIDITKAINKWEPRVNVLNVLVNQIDPQTFKVVVNVKNIDTQVNFSVAVILNT